MLVNGGSIPPTATKLLRRVGVFIVNLKFKSMSNKDFAAIEYWKNGADYQWSATHYGSDAERFCEESEVSNTFASLYTGTAEQVRSFVEELEDFNKR